jgi:hypothetical protein
MSEDLKPQELPQEQEGVLNIPKFNMSRNDYGLLNHIDYIFAEDGSVDWRKMIKKEHVVINKERTQETDISKVPDEHLLILLSGLKDLAFIRGFTSVQFISNAVTQTYVSMTCRIHWIGNYETGHKDVVFDSSADAHADNTDSLGRNFLVAFAENRAFARCIRNFLRINICSKEELDNKRRSFEQSNKQEETSNDPNRDILYKLMIEKGVTFEDLRNKCIYNNVKDATSFASLADIPMPTVFDLIGRLKKKKD